MAQGPRGHLPNCTHIGAPDRAKEEGNNLGPGTTTLGVRHNPGIRLYSGSLHLEVKKERPEEILSQEDGTAWPTKSIDFGDYFEEISIGTEESMVEVFNPPPPPLKREEGHRAGEESGL